MNSAIQLIEGSDKYISACKLIAKLRGKAYLDASFKFSKIIGYKPTCEGKDGWTDLNDAIQEVAVGDIDDFLESLGSESKA